MFEFNLADRARTKVFVIVLFLLFQVKVQVQSIHEVYLVLILILEEAYLILILVLRDEYFCTYTIVMNLIRIGIQATEFFDLGRLCVGFCMSIYDIR